MCGSILLIEDLISCSLIYLKYFLYLFKIKKKTVHVETEEQHTMYYMVMSFVEFCLFMSSTLFFAIRSKQNHKFCIHMIVQTHGIHLHMLCVNVCIRDMDNIGV